MSNTELKKPRCHLAHITVATHLIAASLVLLPILLFELPPLVDFPRTVAQMHILYEIGALKNNIEGYELKLGFVPYLAHDALTFALLGWLGPVEAGRLVLGATLVLTGLAPAVLHGALYQRISPWPLLAWPLVFHRMVFWSFVNYNLALPLLVLATAMWLLSERWVSWLRALAFSVVAFSLMACHLFAWGAFGLIVLGTLVQAIKQRRWTAVLWSSVPFASTGALWLLLPRPSPNTVLLNDTSRTLWYGGVGERLQDISAPVNFDFLVSDSVLAIAAGLLAYWGWRERTLTIHANLRWPLIFLVIVTFLMPHVILGGWGTMRLPVLSALLAVGAVGASGGWSLRRSGMIATIASLIFVFRTVEISAIWGRCQEPLQEVRAALHQLPAGRTVLTLLEPNHHPQCFRRAIFTHVATYAVIDGAAYSPQVGGMSLVFPAPDYRRSEDIDGLLDGSDHLSTKRIRQFQRSGDYLLHIHPGGHERELEGPIMSEGSFFTVYGAP
ncbi:MAG: hypothetical protein EA397_20170 [Deltaproteobacteria bacterium]|nr:MAG: hypothetical protein EA397_20170 [Deltaproteobacteria bacterium]